MKKVLLGLSMLSLTAVAQTPSLQWAKNVNGSLSGYEVVQNSWKDPAGNLLVVGTSSGDAYAMKIDNNGNQLAKIIYDGPKSDYDDGLAIRSDAAGNIYMAGLTTISSLNVPFVVKYNAAGQKVWEYVQTNATMVGAVTAMTLDNYNSPSNVYFTGSRNDSSAIVRLDANTGSVYWEKTLWPHGRMNDIDIDNNGHPLVCGYQAFSGVDADFYAAVLDISSGYPLRGYWRDGFAADSVTDGNGYFDQAYKIKAGPAGTFVVLGNIYNNSGSSTVYMVKFGSVGNIPTWAYLYDSPNHTGGKAWQLLSDVSFSTFYYLAGAMSTTGTYYAYTMAGKVNNTGTAVWEKEFNASAAHYEARDMGIDANGNAHIIADLSMSGDIRYEKLSSANGNSVGGLTYDNQRGGGGAYDYAKNIFLDNTGHPYIIGHSNALTYTNLDILLCRLNTNATLDWDITYDMYINSQDFALKLQVGTYGSGDQIVTCGKVLNNITSLDVSLTSYNETGGINWQTTFDDNNGGDNAVGFERSYYNNFFLCSYNNNTTQISMTEFYSDGTTNFSYHPASWTGMYPACFKLDSMENSFVASGLYGVSDFKVGIDYRNSGDTANTPTILANHQTTPYSIATDNVDFYVAGSISDNSGGNGGQHQYIQKFMMNAGVLWSTQIMGFDSSAMLGTAYRIVYDPATVSLYVVGVDVSVGSSVWKMVLTRINATTGAVDWVRSENMSDARNQAMMDIVVKNGFVYVGGYAYAPSTNDNMLLAEKWDVNGNKQWEYVFDKPGTKEEGKSIAVDNLGNLFVGGKANESLLLQSYSGDALLLKIDPAGNLLWSQEYNGIGNGADECANIGLSVYSPSNERIYMSANTQSSQGYYYDIGTLKFCDLPAATISYSGSTSICQNSSIALAATGTGAGTITWSPGGQSGPVVTANTSGAYYFDYMEQDGCKLSSDTVNINIKGAPPAVQICMVTVDDSSKHNLVIWDKTAATPDVIGFNIYREDLTNIYHQVGSVPVTALSQFVDLDPVANPNSNTKRYKLTTVDSCGNESQMSNYHNTIYIVSNGNGQFSWNQLYTIENTANPVVQYILLRDDFNTNVWQAVDSTAGTQFNINDINFATFQPTANWRVATQWNISCTPTSKWGANTNQSAIVKSKSNISNNRVVGMGALNETNVSAYPNPAKDQLNVTFPVSSKTSVSLINLLGEQVYSDNVTGVGNTIIDLTKLASGSYLLQVSNEAGKFVKRIVKE